MSSFFKINSHFSFLKAVRSTSFFTYSATGAFTTLFYFWANSSDKVNELSTSSTTSTATGSNAKPSFASVGSCLRSSYIVPQLFFPAPPFLNSLPLPVPDWRSSGWGSADTFLSTFWSFTCFDLSNTSFYSTTVWFSTEVTVLVGSSANLFFLGLILFSLLSFGLTIWSSSSSEESLLLKVSKMLPESYLLVIY